MTTLRLASMMAASADFVVAAVADYVGKRLGVSTEVLDDMPWQDRESLLDAGRIDVAWLCGLPYIWKADRPNPTIELLAAPVMRGARYGGQPVYFSDVVVRRDSQLRSFTDLRGTSWAFNETGSHSGYNVVRYHLATLGETGAYFGQVVGSGAHQASLQMLLAGQIEASAIDSTVLEQEIRREPSIRTRLSVLETLGPSPIPPWVVVRNLPQALRRDLRLLLQSMHQDPAGQEVLALGHMARFAGVKDHDYDPIRDMDRVAESVVL